MRQSIWKLNKKIPGPCVPGIFLFFVQQNGAGIDLAVQNGDDGIGGGAVIANTAGIDEPRFSSPVDQRTVSVAKEKEIEILLLGSITGGEKGILYAIGVSMAEKNPLVFAKEQFLGRKIRAGSKTVSFEKADLKNPSENIYIAPLATKNLDRGDLWMDVEVRIEDADFDDGIRHEPHSIFLKAVIV